MSVKLINQRYRPVQILNRGAISVVLQARDVETGELVAIKLIDDEALASDITLRRFEREADLLRQLSHPNIMRLLAFFKEGDNYHLVMPFMVGSILDLIRLKGALPVEWVRDIGLDVCDALIRAHRLGVIHRDIKPDNILLDPEGVPILTDFGVALLVDETRLTGQGIILGSTGYISPEVFQGEDADERSDIWSLGVVFYEMLAGQSLFEGNFMAIADAILHEPIPSLRQARPDIPKALTALIDEMLVKDPSYRIPSVRQVAATLEQVPDILNPPPAWPPELG